MPCRLPKLGEIWRTRAGRLVQVIDLGKNTELQRQRVVKLRSCVGGEHGAVQAVRLAGFIARYEPNEGPRKLRGSRLPAAGERWATDSGAVVVVRDAGDPAAIRRERHITARVIVARGGLQVGGERVIRLSDFLRRWAHQEAA
jgi:hypothetical protein